MAQDRTEGVPSPRSPSLRLGLVAILGYTLCAPLVAWLHGRVGLAATGAAAACCWLGAAVGLIAHGAFVRRDRALAGILSAMSARLAVPLAAALVVVVQPGVLAESGFLYYLVVFYLIMLAAETAILLPRSPSAKPAAGWNEKVVC